MLYPEGQNTCRITDPPDPIEQNIKCLDLLGDYPELKRISKRTSVFNHLRILLAYVSTHNQGRETDRKGTQYYTISIRYLIAEHGGSPNTWQSHLIFLTDAGLIRRILPDERTILQKMSNAFYEAKLLHRKPPVFYSIPIYTKAVLTHANEVAAMYKNKGLSVSKITKADVIRVHGQSHANGIYRDGRKIGSNEEWAQTILKSILLEEIHEHGYATKDTVRARIPHNLGEEKYIAMRKSYERMNQISIDAGCKYHPPTKEDIKRFNLSCHNWIYTPNDQ